jgi:hypothetical protein
VNNIRELGKSKLGNIIPDEVRKKISDKLKGGKSNLGSHWKECYKITSSKQREIFTYKIVDPEDKEYTAGSLHKFCEEYDLNRTALRKGFYKGWCLVSKTNNEIGEVTLIKDPKERYFYTLKKLKYSYELKSPLGELVVTDNLNEFCKKNSLHDCSFHTKGKCKGWTLISKKEIGN